MKILCAILLTAGLLFTSWSAPVDSVQLSFKKALFVYDSIDVMTKIYIESFKAELAKSGVSFDEIALFKSQSKDPANYEYVFIYSRVMAFNFVSPVKKWLNSLETLKDKKVFVFVTANRWFAKDNLKQVAELVNKREGTLVDAISTATKDLSSQQKTAAVIKHLDKWAR